MKIVSSPLTKGSIPHQCLALIALRPDHLTISPPILDKLAAEPSAEVPAKKVESAEVSSSGKSQRGGRQMMYLVDSSL